MPPLPRKSPFGKAFHVKGPPPWGRLKGEGGFKASLGYSAWYPADMAKSLYYTVSLWHSEHLVGLLALVFPASQVECLFLFIPEIGFYLV